MLIFPFHVHDPLSIPTDAITIQRNFCTYKREKQPPPSLRDTSMFGESSHRTSRWRLVAASASKCFAFRGGELVRKSNGTCGGGDAAWSTSFLPGQIRFLFVKGKNESFSLLQESNPTLLSCSLGAKNLRSFVSVPLPSRILILSLAGVASSPTCCTGDCGAPPWDTSRQC